MALVCPRCKVVDLEEIEVGDVPVDRCSRCAGLWFDNAELGEITGMRDKLRKLETTVPDDDVGDEEPLCPRCESVRLRRTVTDGVNRSFVVMRCASCLGTWMDRGELRAEEDGRLIDSLRRYAESLP